jgi:predicted Zn finger-like uncharacterized protein
MVIRCPECATRFKVADKLIGEKPIKLKCSKCKSIFTYQRKSEPVRAPSPSHPRMPVVKPTSGAMIGAPAPREAPAKKMIGEPAPPEEPRKKMIGAPAPEPEPAPALEDEFESFEEEEPEPEESFEEEEPAGDAEQDAEEERRQAEIKARGVMEVDEEDSTAVFEAAIDRRAAAKAAAEAARPEPVPAPAPEPVSQPSLSGPAITLDEMLPAPEAPSRTGRAVGILSAALLGVILVFGLFVLWRNAWDFGALTQDPVHATRASLGLAPREVVSEEAKGIDATVLEWFRVRTAGEHELLVVSGDVYNSTDYPKGGVIVEVSIVNSQGVAVFDKEVVAGITLLTREELGEKSVLEIREQVQRDEEQARKWTINPGRKASFQAYFTSYPPGVDDPSLYTIEGTVTSARNVTEE